jgi:23S rRNA (pseudouridine1915-N3)-methyltransferase
VRLRVVAVGKVREQHLRKAIDDYLDRARHYFPTEEVELADDAGLVRALPDKFSIVALDPRGKALTSEAFAAWIGERMNRGDKGIAFVLGGADGLPAEVLGRATLRMSMSAMTLPHRLARLLLAEQLYRAMTILRREPYSR